MVEVVHTWIHEECLGNRSWIGHSRGLLQHDRRGESLQGHGLMHVAQHHAEDYGNVGQQTFGDNSKVEATERWRTMMIPSSVDRKSVV